MGGAGAVSKEGGCPYTCSNKKQALVDPRVSVDKKAYILEAVEEESDVLSREFFFGFGPICRSERVD